MAWQDRPQQAGRHRRRVRPIATAWFNYLRRVIPPDAHAVQITETRHGFFAGAAFMYQLVLRSTDGDQATVDAMATAVRDELDDYKADLDRAARAKDGGNGSHGD